MELESTSLADLESGELRCGGRETVVGDMRVRGLRRLRRPVPSGPSQNGPRFTSSMPSPVGSSFQWTEVDNRVRLIAKDKPNVKSDIISMAKPFLRWAGSKRKQIPRLREFWKASYSRYVEPFAGSACFFFEIQPTNALISDKKVELMETYELVRDDAEAVYDRIVVIPREKTQYYATGRK